VIADRNDSVIATIPGGGGDGVTYDSAKGEVAASSLGTS
jgi:hypothetical protein